MTTFLLLCETQRRIYVLSWHEIYMKQILLFVYSSAIITGMAELFFILVWHTGLQITCCWWENRVFLFVWKSVRKTSPRTWTVYWLIHYGTVIDISDN